MGAVEAKHKAKLKSNLPRAVVRSGAHRALKKTANRVDLILVDNPMALQGNEEQTSLGSFGRSPEGFGAPLPNRNSQE